MRWDMSVFRVRYLYGGRVLVGYIVTQLETVSALRYAQFVARAVAEDKGYELFDVVEELRSNASRRRRGQRSRRIADSGALSTSS